MSSLEVVRSCANASEAVRLFPASVPGKPLRVKDASSPIAIVLALPNTTSGERGSSSVEYYETR